MPRVAKLSITIGNLHWIYNTIVFDLLLNRFSSFLHPSFPFRTSQTLTNTMATQPPLHEVENDNTKLEYLADSEEGGLFQEFDAAKPAKLLRKVDWRLLPVLSFLYLIAFVDRGNLGNAKVAGLAEDLKLSGSQYNIAATVWILGFSCLVAASETDCPGRSSSSLTQSSRFLPTSH